MTIYFFEEVILKREYCYYIFDPGYGMPVFAYNLDETRLDNYDNIEEFMEVSLSSGKDCDPAYQCKLTKVVED